VRRLFEAQQRRSKYGRSAEKSAAPMNATW